MTNRHVQRVATSVRRRGLAATVALAAANARRATALRIPRPVRLPYGDWAIAWPDVMGANLRARQFEEGERAFVDGFLRHGMVVLDVGAHNGFYTLLAARRVGETGTVVAFEPSSRERRRLWLNIRLNRRRNVAVEPVAVSAAAGTAEIYIVHGRETGFNSLRPPDVVGRFRTEVVQTVRLDDYVAAHGLTRVDFVKIDAEGGELDVLRGAAGILERHRPVVLCELSDDRARAWGRSAGEAFDFLAGLGYRWHVVDEDGLLAPAGATPVFSGNFIAVVEPAGEPEPTPEAAG